MTPPAASAAPSPDSASARSTRAASGAGAAAGRELRGPPKARAGGKAGDRRAAVEVEFALQLHQIELQLGAAAALARRTERLNQRREVGERAAPAHDGGDEAGAVGEEGAADAQRRRPRLVGRVAIEKNPTGEPFRTVPLNARRRRRRRRRRARRRRRRHRSGAARPPPPRAARSRRASAASPRRRRSPPSQRSGIRQLSVVQHVGVDAREADRRPLAAAARGGGRRRRRPRGEAKSRARPPVRSWRCHALGGEGREVGAVESARCAGRWSAPPTSASARRTCAAEGGVARRGAHVASPIPRAVLFSAEYVTYRQPSHATQRPQSSTRGSGARRSPALEPCRAVASTPSLVTPQSPPPPMPPTPSWRRRRRAATGARPRRAEQRAPAGPAAAACEQRDRGVARRAARSHRRRRQRRRRSARASPPRSGRRSTPRAAARSPSAAARAISRGRRRARRRRRRRQRRRAASSRGRTWRERGGARGGVRRRPPARAGLAEDDAAHAE